LHRLGRKGWCTQAWRYLFVVYVVFHPSA
jgi:hypothetical protein